MGKEEIQKRTEGDRRGILWMLLSTFAFALMAASAKALSRIPAFEKVFIRSLLSVIMTIAPHLGSRLQVQRPLLLLLRGVWGFLALAMYFEVIQHIPLANAVVIAKLHPVFTGLFAASFLGEAFTSRQLGATALALVGVVVVGKPDLTGDLQATELMWSGCALIVAVFSATAYTTIRVLTRTEEQWVLILSLPLVSIPLSLLCGWDTFVTPTRKECLWLVALAMSTQIGQIGLNAGLKALPAAYATCLTYSGVIFSTIFGIILGDQTPTVVEGFGAALIFLALLLQ
mmetsp:Transcript_44120/g.73230  ORF Transcript_44120/g.73230 Transcript_44120/m.73230 type:complete len:286 (+) Transcript_44120:201-1058(+)|eukprot:CAMPEP_0119327048 /NCGR_PEP_ID=MMETSP1333-20130426/69806_1 /TAXON_ID=418940 /ORGANISM="Scyphosphaera apsteinii, Strain RCC1455" /LENGTH=285 /DNA_ID=CAMNT_0007335525 /DNA_START=198 /DNA_END=1055 /DNA_ORIENTATION=+